MLQLGKVQSPKSGSRKQKPDASRVTQERPFRLEVEGNDAGAAKGLHPPVDRLGLGEPADFANQLGLNPLAFQRRHEGRECHSVSSSLLAGSSAASLAIPFSCFRSTSIPLFLYSK